MVQDESSVVRLLTGFALGNSVQICKTLLAFHARECGTTRCAACGRFGPAKAVFTVGAMLLLSQVLATSHVYSANLITNRMTLALAELTNMQKSAAVACSFSAQFLVEH